MEPSTAEIQIALAAVRDRARPDLPIVDLRVTKTTDHVGEPALDVLVVYDDALMPDPPVEKVERVVEEVHSAVREMPNLNRWAFVNFRSRSDHVEMEGVAAAP